MNIPRVDHLHRIVLIEVLRPFRYSFVAETDVWVYLGGAMSGNVTGGQGYGREDGGDGEKCN
jgi:hypothetical protein